MDTKSFRPVSKRLTLKDFINIVDIIDEVTKGKEAPLFKHHKPKYELANVLFKAYVAGSIAVYEHTDGYLAGLMGCGVAELWWIDGKVLIEELVVSLTSFPTGFGSFAIAELERIAKDNACVLICSGSSMITNDAHVKNAYRKAGFIDYGSSFLKEVK